MLWYNICMSESEFQVQPPGPLVIVISGPSGAGKDTVVQLMKERGLPFHFVVTATTRPRRNNEVHGRDYFFVSKEEFARMIEQNELIEYAFVYGDYKGIPRSQVLAALDSGKDVVMRLDVQGAETVHRIVKDPVMIFITAENGEELERRLRVRKTETTEELALRIATARRELKRIEEFDYVVVNREDELDETIDNIRSIIEAEHHRVSPRKVEF
jgi:guanylate kinase